MNKKSYQIHIICSILGLGMTSSLVWAVAESREKKSLAQVKATEAKQATKELWMAVSRRTLPLREKVQELLDKGAAVNTKADITNETPLHIAAIRGKEAIAKLLLDRGADINAQANTNETPLHYAVRKIGNEAIVKLLLDRGANINARSSEGNTPLYFAVLRKGNEAIAKLLLDRGADVNARDDYGETPLNQLVAFYYWNDRDKKYNIEPMVKLLLDGGANVNIPDNTLGSTPLHWEAKAGNETIVKLLLDRGADVNARDQNGDTPFHYAYGNKPVAKLLLARGANPKIKNNHGYTAAAKRRKEWFERMKPTIHL